MGIRGKLLLLAAGIAVPLVIVGALDLRNMWLLSRSQLNDSIKQQVDLAAVALERWLDDQKKALDAIALLAGDKDTRAPAIRENLENVIAVPIQKGGAVIARIDGAAINQLFESIELSPQVVIAVVDSDGRILYRRRGSEATSDTDVTWAPVTTEGTDVVELISPIDGVKRVYGMAT